MLGDCKRSRGFESLTMNRTEYCSYGKDDELGFLNRLTDDLVKEAAKEIKTGKR